MHNKIVDDYGKWANNYDHINNPTRDLDQKVLKKLIPNINNKVILEAGCGTGKNTVYFSQFAERVTAFDISPEMLNIARSKIHSKNVVFLEHNILNQWPADNSSIDIVSINLVLEHIQNIEFVFNEAYRVLNENGKLCICELHPEKQLLGSRARFEDIKSKKTIYLESYYHSEAEYNDIGNNAGFRKITINDWYDDDEKIPRIISIIYEK